VPGLHRQEGCQERRVIDSAVLSGSGGVLLLTAPLCQRNAMTNKEKWVPVGGIRDDNVYEGNHNPSVSPKHWYQVRKNGRKFSHERSLKIRSHSPCGFAWAYGGSGPSQLALAILLEETQDKVLAQQAYQDFKSEVIAGLSEPYWRMTSDDVEAWLAGWVQRVE